MNALVLGSNVWVTGVKVLSMLTVYPPTEFIVFDAIRFMRTLTIIVSPAPVTLQVNGGGGAGIPTDVPTSQVPFIGPP